MGHRNPADEEPAESGANTPGDPGAIGTSPVTKRDQEPPEPRQDPGPIGTVPVTEGQEDIDDG